MLILAYDWFRFKCTASASSLDEEAKKEMDVYQLLRMAI